ncbi:MAG: alpha/beta fold hydrolase [Myxococcota bacterium]
MSPEESAGESTSRAIDASRMPMPGSALRGDARSDACSEVRRGGRRGLRRARWRIDVSPAVPFPGCHALAVDVAAPEVRGGDVPDAPDGDAAPIVLACLPGGFLSRRYYDLDPGGPNRYSFSEAMAERGFVTLAFDHFGTGDSTRPEPLERGFELGVEAIARINQLALRRALARLAAGDPDAGLPPLAPRATVGVGHSMGSMLTVEQQALARPHRALVLFSFTTRGVPAFLNEAQRAVAGDPVRARRSLGELARASWGTPYPERATDGEPNRRAAFGVGTAPPRAEALLQDASTNLLGLAGLLSMIPGGYAPPAGRIDVPVYVLVGDHDLHDARGLRDELPKAPVVESRTLADCWHCHFVANGRETIWREVGDWIHRTLGTTS